MLLLQLFNQAATATGTVATSVAAMAQQAVGQLDPTDIFDIREGR